MAERRNITITLCRTPDEVAEAERAFLERLSPAERIALTWELSMEQWEPEGGDESRLSRRHTRLVRR